MEWKIHEGSITELLDLLRLRVPIGTSLIAYADDVTVMIEVNSWREIESSAEAVLGLALEWGNRNHPAFFSAKMKTMTIKGKLQSRPPFRRSSKLGSAVR